jgi:hypothetical protein
MLRVAAVFLVATLICLYSVVVGRSASKLFVAAKPKNVDIEKIQPTFSSPMEVAMKKSHRSNTEYGGS